MLSKKLSLFDFSVFKLYSCGDLIYDLFGRSFHVSFIRVYHITNVGMFYRSFLVPFGL